MKVAVTTLAFCVTSLLALGLVMLYSSSMTQVGARYLLMQLLWCGLGLMACVAVVSMDYQWLKRKEVVLALFMVSLILLALVLVPLPGGVTKKINGAWRWFIFPGGIRVQPSELGKLALIIVLAWYGDRFQRRMHSFKWGIFVPLAVMGLMLGLIFIEPDRGTTVLLAAVGLGILVMAGTDWKKLLIPVPIAIAGLVWSILHDPMRMRRIFSWLDLEQNKNEVGYQGYQAMIALGSGGWFGLGLGNGRQKLGFVPEHHTDFIFSIIGEELGLVATIAVVVAFMGIAVCGFYIALHARETLGTLLAAGITLLICLQAAINIGVVTSALPNKGLPLPFISYGGSNLMAMLTCVGVLLSVARQANPDKIIAQDMVAPPRKNPFSARPA